MIENRAFELMVEANNNYHDLLNKISFAIAMYELGIFSIDELVDWLKEDNKIDKRVKLHKELEQNK